MPPKNKACKNAFYHYMMDFKEKEPGKYKNMQEVAEAAGQYWQKMNADQRRPYEMKAKSDKHSQKIIKYTSSGQNIDVVQKRQKENDMKEQMMKDHIKEMIHLSSESRNLRNEIFYIIHVNYFCYCNTDKRYYPAEVGIAKFDLLNGVTDNNVFNAICKPGSLPLGYSSLAKKVSEDSHQIPPPMTYDTDYNLQEVAESLWEFIRDTCIPNRRLPPVYASKKNQAVVENVLTNFSDDFGLEPLKTYSLEYLFYVLRNSCSEEKAWVVASLSELELEKDKYEFCTDIPCSYHINSDVPNHCSRSHVVRTIYTICDNCCADLDIQLIPGQHVPKKANTNVTRPHSRSVSSAMSSDRNSECRYALNERSGYLSREESDFSVRSETSTLVDVNEYASASGFDSELSQADTDEWFPPLPPSQGLSNSQSSAKQPLRRPTTLCKIMYLLLIFLFLKIQFLAAAFTGARSVAKGRGKGIAANFSGNR
ncbi:hypothetical protein FQR65_LT00608 [Abscondita terminalis]|nr:hypothetical protein FQR65_LT00608 [Abscondita terminalis]